MTSSLVEGIGDEVVHILIGIIIVLLSILAWRSTYIRDIGLYRTIVIVERSSRFNSTNNNNNNNETVDQNQQQQQTIEPAIIRPAVGRTYHTTFNEETRTIHTVVRHDGELENSTSVPTPEVTESGPNADTSCPPYECLATEETTVAQEAKTEEKKQSSSGESTSQDQSTTTEGITTIPTEPIEEPSIRIRLKYLNEEEKVVDGRLNEILGDFKKRHFQTELSSNKVVRLIFNGHILHDGCTLKRCGLSDNCVIHCLVHPRRNNPNQNDSPRRSNNQNNSSNINNNNTRTSNNSATNTDDWSNDLGGLFYAIITIMLCSAWYWRFSHSHLFSFTATAALTSITGIFSVFVFSMFRHNDEVTPPPFDAM